jgi:hypothetical protein
MDYIKLSLACLALLGYVGLYGSFIRMFEPNSNSVEVYVQRALPPVVRDLAYRAIATSILLVLVVIVPLFVVRGATPYIPQAALVGVVKAINWIALFSIVRLPKLPIHLLAK